MSAFLERVTFLINPGYQKIGSTQFYIAKLKFEFFGGCWAYVRDT